MKKILFVVISLLYGVAYSQVCADEDTVRSNAVSLITATTVRVNGTVAHFSGAPASLQLRYVRVGQTDTATASSVPSTALRNLASLQAGTQYYYYYKTICGSGSVSQTIGAYTFTTLANTVLYVPERPTVFNHLKVDSSFIVPEGDTVVGREPSTRAQIRYKSSDNTFYGYYPDCTCWRALAIDSSGIIGLLDGKVDSVTVSGDSLFYWKVGVSYGYILPSVATVWHTTGNTGIDTSTDFIGTTDNVDFPIKTNNVRRFTVNTSGALGIGATPDYGTSGYVLKSAGSAAAPTWTTHTFQNALTAGSTLTQSNTATHSGYNFQFYAENGNKQQLIRSMADSTMGIYLRNNSSNDLVYFLIDGSDSSANIKGGIETHGSSSKWKTSGIYHYPYLGNYYIDTLTNLSTQDEILGRKNSTGQVGYITIGSGLNIGSGVLDYAYANKRNIEYIETNTFTALTGYTAVGSPTYSVTGGKVVFTGAGTGSVSNITKYIRNDLGVLDECNTIQGTVTLDAAPDANSYGVSIGFKTYTTYGNTQSLTAGISTATGANFGKPYIYSAHTSTVYYGTANTDLNNGDVIRISLITTGWTLRLLVQNFTQGWEENLDLPNVGGFNPLTHNGSYPSFFHNGGNVSLDSFKYTINAPLTTDILFVGNSITYGQAATKVDKRWVNLVGNTDNNVMSGGGSEVTADFITRLPEIVAINPARVILHDLAGNDIAQAISSATWQANLITIRNTLNAAGIQVIWTNGQPRTGLDLTAQKTFIEGEPTFAGDMIIDTWAAMLGSGTNPLAAYMSDATHPNDLGMAATANAINAALGFKTDIGLKLGVNTAFSDIGTGSIYGNSSYGLTLRGRTGTSADLTWFDVAGNAVLWIPTGTYDVSTQGKFGVGLIGTSLSGGRLDIAASTTALASIRMRDGVAPSSPIEGQMWKVTDKFYGVISTGAATKEFTLNDIALTSGRVPYNTTNGRLTDVSTFTFGSGLLSVPQIKGSGSAPAIAGGTGAGTTPTVSISGTDLAGIITVTTDTDPTNNAVFCTVTFATAFGTAPYVQLTPADDDAALLTFDTGSSVSRQVYVTSTTTTFVINTNSGNGPIASTQYKWYYQVIQ